MKKQRHFTTEREILSAIFKAERDMAAKLADAETKDKLGHDLIRTGAAASVEAGRFELEVADRLRNSARRLKEVRLYKLKQALSAFQTLVLPGIIEDGSVVLENLDDNWKRQGNRT